MDDQWVRYGAYGGFVFVGLALVGGFIAGQPPSVTDDPREIFDYFDDHDRAIRIGQYLSAVGALPLLWWLGTLWGTLRQAEGGVPRLTVAAALGTVVAAACILVSFAVMSTMATQFRDLGPGGLEIFYTLNYMLVATTAFGAAVLVLASSLVILRSPVFPPWVGWLGLADGVAWLGGGAGLISTRDAVSIVGFVAFLVWLAWIVVVSVFMVRPASVSTGASAP
jgi:hypothetical protein